MGSKSKKESQLQEYYLSMSIMQTKPLFPLFENLTTVSDNGGAGGGVVELPSPTPTKCNAETIFTTVCLFSPPSFPRHHHHSQPHKTMTTHNIVVFGGDHCGPEVVAEAVKVRPAPNPPSTDHGRCTHSFRSSKLLLQNAPALAHSICKNIS
jgi:3-isopropylmalate dehydrogenase